MPTPKPMAIALIRFCTGYTSDRAVIASSLIWATNKLSTILYIALTSIEMTMGSAILVSRGKIGFSFINVSFIVVYLPDTAKSHTMGQHFSRTIVWRKIV